MDPWGPLGLFRSHFEWKAIPNGRLLRLERHSETKANLEFAEVTSNFYGSKAIYKGSEGFGPLNGGLAPEGLSSDIFDSRKPLKRHLQGFGAEATFEL